NSGQKSINMASALQKYNIKSWSHPSLPGLEYIGFSQFDHQNQGVHKRCHLFLERSHRLSSVRYPLLSKKIVIVPGIFREN
ncbi:hypothetical protein, partial [Lyngbya confervoides]